MLSASIVFKRESGAQITTQSSSSVVAIHKQKNNALEDVIGAPLSDLITIGATNIWGKLFLSAEGFLYLINVQDDLKSIFKNRN